MKLKGVTELSGIKQKNDEEDKDKAKLLEGLGTSKKEEEEAGKAANGKDPGESL